MVIVLEKAYDTVATQKLYRNVDNNNINGQCVKATRPLSKFEKSYKVNKTVNETNHRVKV